MKSKNAVFLIVVFALILVCVMFSACNVDDKPQKHVQKLNYSESVEKIDNPDQGFYRPVYIKITDDGVTYNKNIVTESTRLYHLRCDISAFSSAVNNQTDKLLTQSALSGIEEIFSFLQSNDKNAIVRFVYDPSFGGSKDKEPQLSIILKHIEQICSVLGGYENTITAVEVGLIGPWGEMHSSSIADAEHISPIIEAFLTYSEDIPVLVRTPKMIYDYLGITINDIDGYVVTERDKAYRLSLYNDGYLGSSSDLGTYTDREKETVFLSKQTDHLPYGGEVVVPSSNLHDISVCLPEMYQLNLSYLNLEWNDQVISKWKNEYYSQECGADAIYYGETAFRYIENHLGYRFVLKKSTFEYNDKLDKLIIELNLQNVGFGNLNKSKFAQIVFANEKGEIGEIIDVEKFTGSSSVKYSSKLNLESGKYEAYLRIFGEEADGEYRYCLQFANDGLWNDVLKANKIGSIEIPANNQI